MTDEEESEDAGDSDVDDGPQMSLNNDNTEGFISNNSINNTTVHS